MLRRYSEKERLAILESKVEGLEKENKELRDQMKVVYERQDILVEQQAQIMEKINGKESKETYFG